MLYFEKDCPKAAIRGLLPGKTYVVKWFDTHTGEWIKDKEFQTLMTNSVGRISLPDFPSDSDWGLCLLLQ